MHAPQQRRHRREWSHKGKVFRFEQLTAPFLHFCAMIFLLGLRKEHWNKLVTAFANLLARLFEGHMMTEVLQRFLPRARVQVD
jgi:hypothetical protein